MKNKPKSTKGLTEIEKNQRLVDARYLKRGDRDEIAKIAGYTRQAVSVFICGRSNNQRISEAFNRFVELRKAEIKEELNSIK